ncbi:thioredoxin [Pseudoflavitalea sp. G-6-1-2]|uniref:thioredoxin family protein n=1 Tax=Pseudoflavitalea sp. G-6-1-2 TaxID=2728841 RepID=UPI001469AF42|nr:thioredoxin family protein [Pseudoflavitalea sp. G-6-1-2]NML22315.1 thioredoxin [Pseudoflavitalea sp. G-6-1-2]
MKRTKQLTLCCLTALLCCLFFTASAQETGIKFEHGLSWKEIKEKAKRENKFIFMDCFTTWCGPCKMMSKDIFPQKEVGDLFNEKFINVKAQIDQTDKDNEEVKRFYEDAAFIAKEFNVQAYPTFLYFTPDGKLVHLFVGSTKEAKEFIDESVKAFDPATQYFTRMEKEINAAAGNADALRNLAMEAKNKYDGINGATLADAYVKSEKNIFTKDNLTFLDEIVKSSKGAGFRVYLDQPEKVDAIMGKGYSQMKISQLIFMDEGAYDWLNSKGTKELEPVRKSITEKYPEHAGVLMARLNILHLQYSKKGEELVKAVTELLKKYGKQTYPAELASYARSVAMLSNDAAMLKQALGWAKMSTENGDAGHLAVYASLLYKSGKKHEGITEMKKAVALIGKDEKKSFMLSFCQNMLEKMEKGESI